MTRAAPPITTAIPSNSLHLTACIATAPDLEVEIAGPEEDVLEPVDEAAGVEVLEGAGLP
jgi:hypothetical protein